ncbi:MAG: YggT family protein [Gemmatimonadaceae bacterium]
MNALSPAIQVLESVIAVLRPVIFGAAAVTAVAATASWVVRTRRVGPFSALARLTRRTVDPLFLPTEKRVIRMGGTPAQAPWWTVGIVVVAGLVVLALLEFLLQQMRLLAASTYGGPIQIVKLIANWAFILLKVAIMARVIASWVGGTRYSRWWGWSFRLTEWFLAPLRRALPTVGPIDISPLVAYFGLSLLQWLMGGS